MTRAAPTLLCFLLSGCNSPSHGPAATPAAPPATGIEKREVDDAPSPPVTAPDPAFVADVQDDPERRAFASLLHAASTTLRSERFHANLRSLASRHPQVYLHFLGTGEPGNDRIAVHGTVDELSDVIAAKGQYHYVRSPAYLKGDGDDMTALAGWTGTPEQAGSMTIGRFHLARWQSADMVERSCAINTVAHELSHLISNRSDVFMMHITDDHAATLTTKSTDGTAIEPPSAVASYLIGTVAQCTWLEEEGYAPEIELESCVQVFGHRGHNGLRCRSFSGNREVVPRADLPEPYVLVDRQ